MSHAVRRWSPLVTAVVCGALVLTPVVAAHAAPAQDAPLASFDASPVVASTLSGSATVQQIRVSSSDQLRYDTRTIRTVTDGGAVRVEVVDGLTGRPLGSADLSSRLDRVTSAFQVTIDGKLTVYVLGEKAGTKALITVTSTSASDLTSPATATLSRSTVDLNRLVLLDLASSGLLAVQRADDGTYVARRLAYDLSAISGRAPTTLPLSTDVGRRFVMDPAAGNIVALRDGAIDVVSIYDISTVHTLPLADIDEISRVAVGNDSLALADRDGDLAVIGTGFMTDPTLIGTARASAAVRALDYNAALAEYQAVSPDGGRLLRIAAADGQRRDDLVLDGLAIVPGSLASATAWRDDVTFSAAVGGGRVYEYTGHLSLSARITSAPQPQVDTRDAAAEGAKYPDFSLVAQGSDDTTAAWEYSLDGGTSWAELNTPWSSAVPDRGNTVSARPALPAPLDGAAPFVRQDLDDARASSWLPTSYSSVAYAVAIPDSGFGALWRARATNSFSSTASAPVRIAVADGSASAAPSILQHPVTVRSAFGAAVTFSARAEKSDTVRWERSTDGTTWTSVAGASAPDYSFTPGATDFGTRYRAVFDNAAESSTTEAAELRLDSPDPLALGAAPAGSRSVSAPVLNFDLSTYAHEWARARGDSSVAIASGRGFAFGEGEGWTGSDGSAQFSWRGTAVYRPYGGLNGLLVSFSNPYLAVASDGRATLTADVAWNNGGSMEGGRGRVSNGYKRVVVATFAASTLENPLSATGSFSATPEWAGRPYVKPELSDAKVYPSSFPASMVDWLDDGLRGWFLASGSSRDPEKAGAAVTASFTQRSYTSTTNGPAIDPLDPLGQGDSVFADVAPRIVDEPDAVTVEAGASAEVTAKASGSPAPDVQWQRQTGGAWTDIDGATGETLTLPTSQAGDIEVRAVFHNRVGAATSASATITVRAATVPEPTPTNPSEPTPSNGAQHVEVVVPEATTGSGTFHWRFADDGVVSLGTASQSGANFVARGTLNDIVVTDTRTAASTWSISGQVSDFASSGGRFSGGYLGWTPALRNSADGVTIGSGVLSTAVGGAGLGRSSVLAAGSHATGATIGAELTLTAPSTTPAGDYRATLTITALN